MNTAMLIEIFGYIGSALVVISMLMSSVVKLRLINCVGSVISLIYAFIVGAFPLVLMNGCLIVINVYNLIKLLKTTAEYDLVDAEVGDSFVKYILDYYKDDIKIYFPGFNAKADLGDVAYVVCCNAGPAGLLLGKKKDNGDIDIILDYATPAYRDCTVGAFLYEELGKRDVKKLRFANPSEKHEPYLQKMGYIVDDGAYVKGLN